MHLSASRAAIEFHDIGFKFQTGNIQCCIDCTCCISSRGATISVPTDDGDELEVPGSTVVVLDNGALRQFQPLKDKIRKETLFRKTLSGYYNFLADKYTPEIVTIVFATRSVDFIKKYRKGKPLHLSEIDIIKQGLEDIMPYQHTLLWIIKNIHETARDIISGSFIATTDTMHHLQKKFKNTSDQTLLEPKLENEKREKSSNKHKIRHHFLEIAQARGILTVSDVPTLSDKLNVLYKEEGTKKELQELASKGQSIFLRNTEGDKLIRAAKTVYKIFKKEYPKFVTKGTNEPTVDDLQRLLESFSQMALHSNTESLEPKYSDKHKQNKSTPSVKKERRKKHSSPKKIEDSQRAKSHHKTASTNEPQIEKRLSLQTTAASSELQTQSQE